MGAEANGRSTLRPREPTEYLTDVLARIADAKTDAELDALLPDRLTISLLLIGLNFRGTSTPPTAGGRGRFGLRSASHWRSTTTMPRVIGSRWVPLPIFEAHVVDTDDRSFLCWASAKGH